MTRSHYFKDSCRCMNVFKSMRCRIYVLWRNIKCHIVCRKRDGWLMITLNQTKCFKGLFRLQIKMSKSWLWVKLRGFRFCLTEIWEIIQWTMGRRDDTLMTFRVWFGCCMSNYSNRCGVCGTKKLCHLKRIFVDDFDGPAQERLAFDAWCHTQGRSATCLNIINQNDKYMRQMICQAHASPLISHENRFFSA